MDNINYLVNPEKRNENMKLLAQRVIENLKDDEIPIFAQFLNEAIKDVVKGNS